MAVSSGKLCPSATGLYPTREPCADAVLGQGYVCCWDDVHGSSAPPGSRAPAGGAACSFHVFHISAQTCSLLPFPIAVMTDLRIGFGTHLQVT